MKTSSFKITSAALFAALICISTMIIKIPSPLKGYINLGDAFVLLAGWLLSPAYGFLAAGVGSALADFFSGYVLYVPATFLIKGSMALLAYYGFLLFQKKLPLFSRRLFAGFLAEILMILGYYIFEGFLYGFGPSVVNILPNGIQGIAGICLALMLLKILEKNKLLTFFQQQK